MLHMIKGIGALTALQLMAVAPLLAQQPERLFPERPTGLVSDVAGIISEEVEARVEARLARLRDSTGGEVAVVTLPTIDGRAASDEIVIAEGDVRGVVLSVSGVRGCEKIRTRGSADYVFLDLHLWLDGDTPLRDAHATSHVVKDRLTIKFPQLADVVIHIEPPPPHDAPGGYRTAR
jgi:hypothetical protein